jgi:hypothetical protein
MSRSLLDISSLDLLVEAEITKYGSLKDFQVTLYRQELDATGCNWNARIERIGRSRGEHESDLTWWDIVPQLRERFNLT